MVGCSGIHDSRLTCACRQEIWVVYGDVNSCHLPMHGLWMGGRSDAAES